MSSTMRAVGMSNSVPYLHHKLTITAIKNGTGPAGNLFIDNIPKPAPSAGEALVKIKAFGLNRMDLLQREGRYPVPPQAPATMGVEFSGVIEGFGPDVNCDFKVGDEIFGLAYGGLSSLVSARGRRGC